MSALADSSSNSSSTSTTVSTTVSPSFPRKRRKYSPIHSHSHKNEIEVITTARTTAITSTTTTTRAVTPPSIVQRTDSPPPNDQSITVTPYTSPNRSFYGVDQSQYQSRSLKAEALSMVAVAATPPPKIINPTALVGEVRETEVGKYKFGAKDVKPLIPPPPMRNFDNFQKNANMQKLSLLAKKNSHNAHSNRNKNISDAPIQNIHKNDNSAGRAAIPEEHLISGNEIGAPLLGVLQESAAHTIAISAAASAMNESCPPLTFCFPTGCNLQQQFLQTLAIQAQLQCLTASSPQPVAPLPPLMTPSSASHDTVRGSPTKKRKICKMDGCDSTADKRTPYCLKHRGQRKCEHPDGCIKFAQSKTRFCIKHGGGRRCTFPNCNKGARDKFFCGAHGGGKRCTAANCAKLAVGCDSVCTAHGGGKRCQKEGCNKSAQSSSFFCVRHGGGRKCKMDGCRKVARGKLGLCMGHATATNKSD